MPVLNARRVVAFGVGAGVGLVVVAVAVNLALFVWPSTSDLQPADAVVVLAGGHGERLDLGLELVRRGVAPTLVASTGPDRLCRSEQRFEVVCFVPSPATTRGEAESIGRLARERAWKKIVLVTSTYHVSRARLLVGRCYSGHLEVAAAEPDQGVGEWIGAIVHEWGGLADTLFHRGC